MAMETEKLKLLVALNVILKRHFVILQVTTTQIFRFEELAFLISRKQDFFEVSSLQNNFSLVIKVISADSFYF